MATRRTPAEEGAAAPQDPLLTETQTPTPEPEPAPEANVPQQTTAVKYADSFYRACGVRVCPECGADLRSLSAHPGELWCPYGHHRTDLNGNTIPLDSPARG